MKSNIRIHRNWKSFRVSSPIIREYFNAAAQFPIAFAFTRKRKKKEKEHSFNHSFIRSFVHSFLLFQFSLVFLLQSTSKTLIHNSWQYFYSSAATTTQKQQFSFYIILKLQSISMTARKRYRRTDRHTDRYKNNKPQTTAQLYVLCINRGKLL